MLPAASEQILWIGYFLLLGKETALVTPASNQFTTVGSLPNYGHCYLHGHRLLPALLTVARGRWKPGPAGAAPTVWGLPMLTASCHCKEQATGNLPREGGSKAKCPTQGSYMIPPLTQEPRISLQGLSQPYPFSFCTMAWQLSFASAAALQSLLLASKMGRCLVEVKGMGALG